MSKCPVCGRTHGAKQPEICERLTRQGKLLAHTELELSKANRRAAELEMQVKAKDDQIGIYLALLRSKDAMLASLMGGCNNTDIDVLYMREGE